MGINREAKRNYQKELDSILNELAAENKVPNLLLHSCCAPCSSYVLEYLSEHFRITDFFYNPNITEEEEYRKRAEEMKRLIGSQPHAYPVAYLEGNYDRPLFFEISRGLETCPEGGERCRACFRLRLRETAETASRGFTDSFGKKVSFDFMTTTLTISPLKDARVINEIGEECA